MINQRNVAVCIVLTLVTCGIYGIYWFICLTDDANTVSRTDGVSGVLAFILSLITCGIYSLYWLYKQGEKIDDAKTALGATKGSNGILYLILGILGFSIIAYALMQNELNKMA